MTALFNAPSAIIGLLVGMLMGSFLLQHSDSYTDMEMSVAEANQLVSDCEAKLPRNLSCKLTAEVVK